MGLTREKHSRPLYGRCFRDPIPLGLVVSGAARGVTGSRNEGFSDQEAFSAEVGKVLLSCFSVTARGEAVDVRRSQTIVWIRVEDYAG